jgi:GNAT superfamily N-acetyltransferase
MTIEHHTVQMIRRDLRRIPQHAVPSGYSIRWHRRGDRESWVRIQRLAERLVPISAELYEKEFGHDEPLLSQRQAFLVDEGGHEIGTATAWFDGNYHGERYGRIHWVAIVPEHQGRGLAKPLLTAVCNRLVELGHDRAYLVTSTARLPAISLYLRFGFEPDIRSDQDREIWQPTLNELRRLGRTPRE